MRCEYGEWTTPRTLNGAAVETAPRLRLPSLVSAGGTIYVAGNELPASGADTIPGSPLQVWELGGRNIGKPIGSFQFVRPKVLTDEGGRLHLVWGEAADSARPATAADYLRPTLPITSVWTAAYKPEVGWSVPHKVIAGAHIPWLVTLRATSGDTTPNRWAFSVVDRPQRGDPRLVLVRFNDGELVATDGPRAGRPFYNSLASDGSVVHVGFVSPATAELTGQRIDDINSVFLHTSSDSGATWSRPVLVSRSGKTPAFDLSSLVTPDGVVHLVSRQERANVSAVIRHVASSDRGRTWSSPDDLVAPPQFDAPRVATDRCGTLHLVFRHLESSTGRLHLDYARWRDGWSAVQHAFTSLDVDEFELYHAPDDRLLLSFSARSADAPPDTRGPILISELPIR